MRAVVCLFPAADVESLVASGINIQNMRTWELDLMGRTHTCGENQAKTSSLGGKLSAIAQIKVKSH